MRRFEAVPLPASGAGARSRRARPLFESIVTVQNLPFVAALQERADRLGVESARYIERTHYPITVTVLPGPSCGSGSASTRRRFAAGAIERMLGQLRALLRAMADDPDRRLADLPWMPTDEQRPAHRAMEPARRRARMGAIPDLDRLDEGELDVLIDRLG